MARDRSLLRLSLHQMADLLARHEVSSTELVRAHLDRLDEIQPRLRPMASIFHERAMAMAAGSDNRRRAGQVRGPLDGLPLTLKENFDLVGEPTTLGMPGRRDHRAESEGVLVGLLREAGCVFLGKTNLSQAMLFHESRNPLFGQTANPYDETRTPGGSSGGEACAIAAYGSPAGLGTDIGGSIRVPAHFCGVFGLKPTVDRISNLGIQSSIPGQEVVRGQVGPFARSAVDLSLLLSAISPARCAAQDPRVAPLPLFRDAVEPGRLRVGYFCDDGIVSPSVAVRRATETAKRLLEAAGCTLVPFDPPLTEELVFTYLAALSADGGKTVFDGLAPADVDPALALLATWVRLPAPLRRLGRVGVDYAGERLLARMLAVLGEKSVASLFALTQRARQIQHAVFEAWNQQELDAVICPPHATPALKHGQSRDFTLGGALSIRYNFVNFPAGVAPITRVAAAEGTRPHPRRRLDKQAAEVDQDSAGLPVGVQVVARPYREDVVLRLLELLDEGARDAPDFPRVSMT